jgi:hypothetical protein
MHYRSSHKPLALDRKDGSRSLAILTMTNTPAPIALGQDKRHGSLCPDDCPESQAFGAQPSGA